MFATLSWAIVAIVALAMVYAYSGSRDVFHPLMFIGPMMIFMYAWMPLKLDAAGGLDGFFQRDQLEWIQWINIGGVSCFVLGCLSVGCKLPSIRRAPVKASPLGLLITGTIAGCVGLGAWLVTIINVGGLQEAFSKSYAGGWDDNGYIRDASLLMFPAFLLILAASLQQGFRILNICLMALFIAPWVTQAAFTARRGPTFMIAILLGVGSYLHRGKRPSIPVTCMAGSLLGFLMLFLVTNRGNIFLGSDREVTTDVTEVVGTADTGNEYIYGAGGMLSAEQRKSFYWGKRYLAQVLVRPIPHALWPTKYDDVGLGELTHNAGTGEGFVETLGWQGAEGAAPGLIADLWMEFWWLNLPVLFLLGRFYGRAWRETHLSGGVWNAQYTIMSALTIYLVMQTMEAVIFRLLILSFPLQVAWSVGKRSKVQVSPVRMTTRSAFLTTVAELHRENAAMAKGLR